MPTFYSFPHEFGESRELITLDVPAAAAAEAWADMVLRARESADELARAVMEAVDQQIVLNYIGMGMGMGMPNFETEEEMRDWFRQFGIELPENMPLPTAHLTTRRFLKEAKTLRQRCFAWLFSGWNDRTKEISVHFTDVQRRKIHPFSDTLRGLIAACRRDPEVRRALSALPISRGAYSARANPELLDPLQDLADIVTQEIRLAYEAEYYPRPVDVDALTDEHVEEVMEAMQREIDREQRRRPGPPGSEVTYKRTAHLPDLPWDRKVALAERRRRWFGVFGITPKSWRSGTWSLWKVQNVPYPDGYAPIEASGPNY